VKSLLEKGELTGHVGYAESVMLVCDALDFKPDEIKERQEIVAEDDNALGLKGFGSAIKNGREVVKIEFHAYANAEEYEEILIEGDNNIRWRSSGTRGDLGTVAMLINLAEFVVSCESGLMKMSDIIPFRSVLVL
jgi:4-hydroxy-tetrahydrodipicolinate reductase